MGQKVNPIGLRLGINRTWDSRWYADSDYALQLHQDLELRRFLKKRLAQAGVLVEQGIGGVQRLVEFVLLVEPTGIPEGSGLVGGGLRAVTGGCAGGIENEQQGRS